MPKKKPTSHRTPWTTKDDKTLRQLVRSGTPASEIAAKLGRTPSAVRQYASLEGVSFRAAARRRKR